MTDDILKEFEESARISGYELSFVVKELFKQYVEEAQRRTAQDILDLIENSKWSDGDVDSGELIREIKAKYLNKSPPSGDDGNSYTPVPLQPSAELGLKADTSKSVDSDTKPHTESLSVATENERLGRSTDGVDKNEPTGTKEKGQ